MTAERWDEESTDEEYRIMEVWTALRDKYWGNSYIATTQTSLTMGVPGYVIVRVLERYEEVYYDL